MSKLHRDRASMRMRLLRYVPPTGGDWAKALHARQMARLSKLKPYGHDFVPRPSQR